jgi:arylsulfatase A-like enzyme
MNWPYHVPAGKTFHGLTSAMDIFPTSFKLAGGKTTPRPLDGVNLMPFLNNEVTTTPHQNLFWKKLEGSAVRSGNWKMIQTQGLPTMLYNLQNDLSEYKNIAEQHPEKVNELQNLYLNWNKQTVPAQWGEAERYVEIRREDYIRFRDSGRPLKLNSPRKKKNKKTK